GEGGDGRVERRGRDDRRDRSSGHALREARADPIKQSVYAQWIGAPEELDPPAIGTPPDAEAACAAALLLGERREHLVGRERQLAQTDADRVVDRVRDRGRRRDDAELADALRAVRPVGVRIL